MSSAFGVAAVTAVMRAILSRRLADARAAGVVEPAARVTARPPDRVVETNGGESCLNLFLLEVAQNMAWGNRDLPSRGPDDRAVSNPVLALDLLYLLSAHGVEDLEPEILLGHAMQAFRESPVLSRAAIRALFDPGPTEDPLDLPRAFRERAITIADQIESIRITPYHLRTGDMARFWTSLSAHYRPSVAYQATVVLIPPTT